MIDYSKVRYTYEAQSLLSRLEYLTREEAVDYVVSQGSGQVIKWLIERNLPGCQPDYVHKSLSLDVYESGYWRSVNIF